MQDEPEASQQRMRAAFELNELGMGRVRAQLRREHLEAEDEEIDALLREWSFHRADAESGDAGRIGFRASAWKA